MRKRRVLSCVLSAFIICSITCGPTSVSATYNTLDDMEIDPWGDLSDIQGFEPPTPELAPDDFDPVTMFPDVDTYFIDDTSTVQITTNSDLIFKHKPSSSGTVTSSTIAAGDYNRIASESGNYELVYYESSFLASWHYYALVVPSGFIADFAIDGSFAAGTYKFDGTVINKLYVDPYYSGEVQNSFYAYPYQVDLIGDEEVLFTVLLTDEGTYTFDSVEIDVPEDITSLGYRFYFSGQNVDSITWKDATSQSNALYNASIGFNFSDSVSITLMPEDATVGLLEGVIGWLQGILEAITELPQNIANFVLEGLQGLFIPDQEELTALMDKYNVLFEERLGFIYQMFTFVVDSFTTWIETMKAAEDYSFTFPGISFPYNGDVIEIVPEQEVSLDNAVMDVLRPVLGTIVSIVCVLAFTNTCFDLVIALMSGQSYLEFIGRRREELDE